MAKTKGKEKPTASNVPPEVDDNNDEVIAEEIQSEPVKMEEAEDAIVDARSDKAEEEDEPEEEDELEDADKPEDADMEETEKKEEVKEDRTVEVAMVTVTPGVEKGEEGDKKEEVKGDEKIKKTSGKKAKRNRKKKAAGANAAASNGTDKPEPSAAEKNSLKKADGMGLIFMCNSKTKKDCFRYNIFGLPESKKGLVEKVYKGMRLFLFDIDLKLMYGIYKAASPGGYNIEPKAFKSAFPCQVRFTVLKDCKPLPEEKFKAAIKANYFGKNRFNVQLSREQVNNLCKLFASSDKGSKQKHAVGTSKAPISIGRDRDRRRRPPRDTVRHNESYYPRGLTYRRDDYASPLPRPVALPPPLPPLSSGPLYPRDDYPSPLPRPIALHPPPPPPPQSYAYERPVEDYYYRREPLDRVMDVEIRPRDPIEYRDPYGLYREPAPYREAGYLASRASASAYAPPSLQYRY